ncbi:unnamed protein product, partial [Closterium sp. Naga37s-1]
QVLLDCQKAWGTTFDAWVVGGDCEIASSVTCDSQGMITQMGISNEKLKGTIPDSISKPPKARQLILLEHEPDWADTNFHWHTYKPGPI